MEVLFYLFSIIAVISTVGVILSICPVYALLCLMVSFLSISCIFFVLGAYFSGALEVIIYAGAIVVLFVFVVMLLNVDCFISRNNSLIVEYDVRKLLLIFLFLMVFLFLIFDENNDYYCNNQILREEVVTLKSIGMSLFGPYIFLVEMASMLLLGSLLISFRIGRSFVKSNDK